MSAAPTFLAACLLPTPPRRRRLPGARAAMAAALLAGLSGCASLGSPPDDGLRYRLQASGMEWRVNGEDAVFADVQARYPDFFATVPRPEHDRRRTAPRRSRRGPRAAPAGPRQLRRAERRGDRLLRDELARRARARGRRDGLPRRGLRVREARRHPVARVQRDPGPAAALRDPRLLRGRGRRREARHPSHPRPARADRRGPAPEGNGPRTAHAHRRAGAALPRGTRLR